MKNCKFSHVFAAILFVVCLAFAGCTQPTNPTPHMAIEGTWVSSYGEKYEITNTNYRNYYTSNGKFVLYYTTNNLSFREIDSKSGYVYGQFDNGDYVGYGAKVGDWYALYYTDLTDTSVKLWQPYKAGGKACCENLYEAINEFTVANGYYAAYSECAATLLQNPFPS